MAQATAPILDSTQGESAIFAKAGGGEPAVLVPWVEEERKSPVRSFTISGDLAVSVGGATVHHLDDEGAEFATFSRVGTSVLPLRRLKEAEGATPGPSA
jgi:hypothetical protein